MEKRIKVLLEERNIEDPDIYQSIYDLCLEYLVRNKKLQHYSDAEEVAMIMSEELYIKVLKGGSIVSWIGYIFKSYQAFIRIWRRMNSSQIIDVSFNNDLKDAIILMSSSINNTIEYQKVIDKAYLESIPEIIDNVVKKSRYIINTREYINARLSILLSLLYGRYISYGQCEEDKMYTNILLSIVKARVVESVSIPSNDYETSGLSLLQLYTLENNTMQE